MSGFWDDVAQSKPGSRLASSAASTPGVSSGGFWDNLASSTSTKPPVTDSPIKSLGRLASFATSGNDFIKTISGGALDPSTLPGYLSKPIDILASPVGIASLAAAPFTGGASLAELGAAGVASRVGGAAITGLAGGLVGGEAAQLAAGAAQKVGAPDWLQTGVGIGAGLAAGGLTGSAVAKRLPGAFAEVGEAQGAKPANLGGPASDPFVLQDSVPGLSKVQQVSNFVKGATGLGVKARADVTPVLDNVRTAEQNIRNIVNGQMQVIKSDLAGRADIKYGKYANGEATLIKVGDTWEPIQDVAAKPSDFNLSTEQRRFIEPLHVELGSWKRMYENNGGYIGTRGDLAPDGLFLPRGIAAEDGTLGMVPYDTDHSIGGNPSNHAVYPTMKEGLENGVKYPPVEDAIRDYMSGVGRATVGRHAANELMKLKNEDGSFVFRPVEGYVPESVSQAYMAAQSAKAGATENLNTIAKAGESLAAQKSALENALIAAPSEEAKAAIQTQLDDLGTALTAHEANLGTAQTTLEDAVTTHDIQQKVFETSKNAVTSNPALDEVQGVAGMKDLVGPRAVTDTINAQLNPNGTLTKATQVASTFNDTLRAFHTTLDFAFGGRLAPTTLLTHPFDYFKGVQTGFNTMFNRQAMGQLFKATDQELAGAGIPLRVKDMMKYGNLAIGDPDMKIPALMQKVPGMGSAAGVYSNAVTAMRINMMKTELLNAQAAGRALTPDSIRSIGNAINLTTGASIHKPVKGSQLFIQFPNWMQSQFEFLTHGAAGLLPGASFENRYAAQALVKLVGTGLATTYAVNAMEGRKTEYSNGVPIMRIGDQKLDVFGPYGTLVQGMYAALKPGGDVSLLLRARVSPLFQIGWDLGSGHTFNGDPAKMTDPSYWLKAVAPYGASGLLSGQDATSSTLEALGLRSHAATNWQKMQDQVQLATGKQWADLTGKEREQMRAANPDLVTELQKETETKAANGDQVAKGVLVTQGVNDNLLKQQQTLNQQYQTGAISPEEFRKQLVLLQGDAGVKKQQIRADYGLDTNQSTRTPTKNQTALNLYYGLYDKADSGILAGGTKTGQIDWTVFDQLSTDLMARLDPEQQKAIQDRVTVHDPSIDWYYKNKDLIDNSGYFQAVNQVVDRMKTGIQAAIPGAQDYTDVQQALNKAQREGNQGKAAQLTALISRITAASGILHNNLTRQDPHLYKALVENGYLKQAQSRPLAANIQ